MQFVGYGAPFTANTGRGYTPSIWNKMRLDEFMFLGTGTIIQDDFVNWWGTVTSNVGTYASQSGGWKSFEDTGDSALQIATEVDGVLRLLTDTTDNDSVSIASGGDLGGQFKFTSGLKNAFEARIRVDTVVTQDLFIGMTEEGLAVDNGLFSDADAVADKDYVGFILVAGASATLKGAYNTAGGTDVDVADATTTLVAATWVKVGWYFDGTQIQYYVNGVKVGSPVLYTATGFPDGEELVVAAHSKNGAGAARQFDIDWLRAASEKA